MNVLSPAAWPGALVLESRYSETINRPAELMCKTRREPKNVQSDVIRGRAGLVFAPSLIHTSTFV